MVRPFLRRADRCPDPGLARDRGRRARARVRTDGLGQDARGVSLGARPPRRRPLERPHADRLRLAAEGPLLRRREEPARPAEGDRRRSDQRRPADRRHAAEGAPGDAAHAARRPDHDARVALPDAHVEGARDLRRRRGRDRRRDPRGRPHQARCAPRSDPRAPRPRGRRPGPAHRPVGDPEPPRGGRPLPRRRRPRLPARRHGRAQAARPEDPRARRRHARARLGRRPERRAGRHGRHAPVDLAGDLPGAARAGARAHFDDRLREQPPRRRAPGIAPERARRRGRCPRHDRARPPWLPRARGASGGRGPAQVRRAALHRRHLVARARDRHGRRRPGGPGRVAEVGDRRPPADRPRRPQRRRRVEGADLPEVPRRPARVRGRRQADARRADRDDGRARQPARRGRPADRRDGRRQATSGACPSCTS